MYSLLRPLLFGFEPELVHQRTLQVIRLAGVLPPLGRLVAALFRPPARPVRVFGLDFANPVGLAAGYDKDGVAWRGLAALGFGHIEIGTVTPLAQPGNPRPRVFRLPEDRALINRMGFPGRGARFVMRRMRLPHPPGLVLGVNLGKNKDTPLEEAVRDYLVLTRAFAPLSDYLAINVSSPNTSGLRRLQNRQALLELLAPVQAERRFQEKRLGKRLPLVVKLAPDLSSEELDDALEVMLEVGVDGVIAANTSLGRSGLTSPLANESGGLSGAPLGARSTAMIRQIYQRTGGRLPIIGAGGIMRPQDALEKLEAGASLVQVYTGLVYAGPGLVRSIVRSL